MRTSKLIASLSLLFAVALLPTVARAGHNGSPALIRSAIDANSIDAIQAELERSEFLVCAACTDMVLPLIDHADYRVRKAAAWWLVRRATGRQVFVNMLTRLSQPDSVKAANAADVLGEFHAVGAVPALSAALSNPIFDAAARAAMARALGSIGRPEAAPALVSALGAAEPPVKMAALSALQAIGAFKDASPAEPLLSDADAGVRGQAAQTFGVVRSQAGVASLLRVLASDPSPDVRKKAAWALGEIGAPASLASAGLQQAATSDESPVVRSLAEVAIGKLTR